MTDTLIRMTDTLIRWGSGLVNIPMWGIKLYLLSSAIVFVHVLALKFFKVNILGNVFKIGKIVGKSVVVSLCWPFLLLSGGDGDTHLAYRS
jgi:hypothetical protein